MTVPGRSWQGRCPGGRLMIVQTKKRYGALAGIAAAAVAIGLGELIGLAVEPRSGPLVAVGGVVVDKVPEGGKDLAIKLFGTYDKFALQVGTIVVLLAFAAVIGILGLRRLWYGLAGIGVFGAVGLIAALTRTGATIVWVVPTLVATDAAMVTLYLLLRMLGQPQAQADALQRFLRRPAPETNAPVREFDRRKFLWAAPRSSGTPDARWARRRASTRPGPRSTFRRRPGRWRRPHPAPPYPDCPMWSVTTTSTGSTPRCCCRASTRTSGH